VLITGACGNLGRKAVAALRALNGVVNRPVLAPIT
jgi:uncharacterized protein YbjT (DUF2867 family)